MLYLTNYLSPIGELTLGSDGTSIKGLWLKGQKYYMRGVVECSACDNLEVFDIVKAWLDAYFSGCEPTVEVPLAPEGTEFQKRVWKALEGIPYGTTVTYGEIAKRIGCASSRAVGNAVSKNPIMIIIPCHRVIGANGSITGFAGGIDAKIALLSLERR